MPRDASFWRNLGVVGLLHVAALAGLARWSGSTKKPAATNILWMDGGASPNSQATAASDAATPVAPEAEPAVMPSPPEGAAPEEPLLPKPTAEEPSLAAANSDIPMPTPTATATATPRETPAPTMSPVKGSTKPSPTATPKTTPKKALLAKVTPPSSPKPTAALVKKTSETGAKRVSVKPDVPIKDAARDDSADAATTGTGNTGASGAGRGSGPGSASQFGWYASMLHDRFFSEWVQPTTVVAAGAKMSALVRIRIEKDGRVSSFEIVKPSGNVVVDESVAAVAKRVTQVDPLPAGLGNAGHYDVNINFELD